MDAKFGPLEKKKDVKGLA